MKKNVLLFTLLLISYTTFAQYPAPNNFNLNRYYLEMYDSGVGCSGYFIEGPAYMTSFRWEAPDLAGTNLELEGYKIYLNEKSDIYDPGILTSSTTIDRSYCKEIWFTGEAWVTAIYSDGGESAPSNIQERVDYGGLPISIQKVDNVSIGYFYDEYNKTIKINGIENVSRIEVIDFKGSIVKTVIPSSNTISVEDINKGVYIIRIVGKNSEYNGKILKL